MDNDEEIRPCLAESAKAVHDALLSSCGACSETEDPDEGIKLAVRIEILARAVSTLEMLRRSRCE